MTAIPLPPVLDGFSKLADRYDLLLCDIWGVVHNGVSAHQAACEALVAYRKQGGTVVLVSNAPRPNREIKVQLAGFGVPAEVYDAVVTSGDVTVTLMAERAGEALHHIGPARDLPMFEAIKAKLVDLEAARYVVCTGLFEDEIETPDDYQGTLKTIRGKKLPMICANPDLVVERGHKIIYCAGAIADAYGVMGGEVTYAGKPHPPIYEMAMAQAAAIKGKEIAKDRIIAIGDAIRTDVTGARRIGVAVIFVSAGIHQGDIHGEDGFIEPTRLDAFLATSDLRPDYVMRYLVW